jgi:putative transposase
MPQMTPEGLYGRRKMLALILRQDGLAGAFRGALDRTMRTLGVQASSARGSRPTINPAQLERSAANAPEVHIIGS